MSQIKFEGRNAQFFSTLRNRIDNYFTDNDLKPTGNWRLYLKTIILFVSLATLYTILVFFTPENHWVSLGLCVLMGANFAGIGFNVMHDGAHGSYSSKKWVNDMMAYSLNMLGGNSFFWVQKHNVAHHSFTNIEGADEDIDVSPYMRVNSHQPKFWFHKFQYIYGWLLYCITYLAWIYYQDFNKYATGKIGDRPMRDKFTVKDHFIFWIAKIGYLALFLGLPIYYAGLGHTLIGYLVLSLTTGLVITMVFQLAHIVEGMDFVESNPTGINIENDWATHQLSTTANFGTKSKVLAWYLGGLNFQVEHHLFPKISHIHYPKINKIVKETCAEFNVMYHEFPTMLSAVRSHFMLLKQVGA